MRMGILALFLFFLIKKVQCIVRFEAVLVRDC